MIAKDHDLPIKRQARVTGDLTFLGLLPTPAGRHRMRRLMRIMGIEAIYRKKNTVARHSQHPVYPYLLRNLVIDRPNQVWATDIAFVSMARGFVYLVAVID